ncbi:MAG: dCTP deaminase [Alphaproteobacteria bacterium]|nr:MAG: dCTP deaminase [Alphaproteobacteria bacterium]
MKLADNEIIACLRDGRISITPAPAETAINGASVDLRLGPKFRVFSMHTGSHIDLGTSRAEINEAIERTMSDEITLSEDEVFYLHPGELALGATLERVELAPDICGSINGRSSLARLGLMVHSTAHFVDPGWRGQLVLEFYNCGRLPLGMRPGMSVCAIAFEPLSSAATRHYGARQDAKYAGQTGATASRFGSERS